MDIQEGIEEMKTTSSLADIVSVCCKILESLIWDHMMNYLLETDQLSDKSVW